MEKWFTGELSKIDQNLENSFTGETNQYWTHILLWRNGSILETYFTMEKWINIGHLFYYGETDQYWTPILLWRNGSILDTYFTMEKGISIGQLFYPGESDQYWTNILLESCLK